MTDKCLEKYRGQQSPRFIRRDGNGEDLFFPARNVVAESGRPGRPELLAKRGRIVGGVGCPPNCRTSGKLRGNYGEARGSSDPFELFRKMLHLIWKNLEKIWSNLAKIQQNFGKICEILGKNNKKSAIFNENFEIRDRCKGVHYVDLGESFPTSIYLQILASIQPRTSLVKFARSPRTDPRPSPDHYYYYYYYRSLRSGVVAL